MHIEQLTITNFRCFGPKAVRIELEPTLTAMIGANGAGKTAALEALLRIFGTSQEQRRIRVRDFHVPADESDAPDERTLSIDAVLAFPELADDDDDQGDDEAGAVPEFFLQMAAGEEAELKCRIRLDATWASDGSIDGTISESLRVVRTLDDDYEEDDWNPLSPADRARIQMIYVPAFRDGARHLTAFLRSRLWRAAKWSDGLREQVDTVTDDLNDQFSSEAVVESLEKALATRWQELHAAGTNANPTFRPVDRDFAQFVGKAELLFEPTETGHDRRADELSDGQRSLLHIALTAATLDVEGAIFAGKKDDEFDVTHMGLPRLTILAVEEPENSLAPYFLSRIVAQIVEIAGGVRAQALVSSHSASVLGRVEPESVRHFRLTKSLVAAVNRISLPESDDEAGKFVREAVRAYPELYFARFVVLGEGSSEEVALPILAEARGVPIDRSFVAVVPLGGRHVNHMWRLLNKLRIPHATLLDLDRGRSGGGEGRIKNVCKQLKAIGLDPFSDIEGFEALKDIKDLADDEYDEWLTALREFDVYFCDPLDLDLTLLTAFFDDYTALSGHEHGPGSSDPVPAVLGEDSDPDLYDAMGDDLRWYRYLFLGRSKPSTHLRVLGSIPAERLCNEMPEVLEAVVDKIEAEVN